MMRGITISADLAARSPIQTQVRHESSIYRYSAIITSTFQSKQLRTPNPSLNPSLNPSPKFLKISTRLPTRYPSTSLSLAIHSNLTVLNIFNPNNPPIPNAPQAPRPSRLVESFGRWRCHSEEFAGRIVVDSRVGIESSDAASLYTASQSPPAASPRFRISTHHGTSTCESPHSFPQTYPENFEAA